MGGLFLLGSLGSSFVLLIPVVLVLALLVILALRHDDDADERRAPAIYGSIIAVVGTLTVLYASTGLVATLLELTKDGDHGSTVTTGVVLLIVAVSAGALLYVHQTLFALRHGATGAARRVHRAYVLVVCLITALTAMVAGGLLLFQLYGLVSPDDAGTTRGDAVRVGLTMLALLAGSAGLWRWHWRQLELSPAAAAP